MAGNIQADNNGNILVEFDVNNLIVVDPNKTIDNFGNIKERLVDHENLVMYANLEAQLLPRTKLAVGVSPEEGVSTVSIGSINFLKPNKQNYFGTGYYDELTGEDTTKRKGENQMQNLFVNSSQGKKPYFINQPADLNNIEDNGLLGITSINISTTLSLVPEVKIELEDVQGKALFQLGDNSPYSAFFNLPYPIFYLTLKGYYGQAIKYQLNLEKFNARFNTFSGNYMISLSFRGYKFNVLNEISMGHLLATPHMYASRFDVKTDPIKSQQNQKSAVSVDTNNLIQNTDLATSNSEGVTQVVAKKGYQKILEVYSEYKSKGLIPMDFPELSLQQFMNKIENFEQNIIQSFPKVEVEPLTNIRTYKENVVEYFQEVRGTGNSWFTKFLNPIPLILKDGKRVYTYKNELNLEKRTKAYEELKGIVEDYNKLLGSNKTLGTNGTDTIVNPIKFDTLTINDVTLNQIDWIKMATERGLSEQTIPLIRKQYSVLNEINIELTEEKSLSEYKLNFYIFDGDGRFDKQLSLIEAEANRKLANYEASISDKLLKKISDKATGIGFKPTVRNIIAVIMASAEAFLRLMDEVHTNAWAVKYDPVRKRAILDNPSSAPGSDQLQIVKKSANGEEQQANTSNSKQPVYPWPQFFVETSDDKNRFQLKYIADPSVVDITQGYLYSKWPEVEFLEEYLIGFSQKFDPPAEPPPLDNELYTNRLNINAIEFPNLGLAYVNKEEVKFFYEIWERQFLTSRYSNLIRANQNQIDELIKLNIETEVNNIFQSVNISSPYLALKLKNFNLNSNNYINFLQTISNQGTGRAYQDFIRDFFVTPYLREITENSFGFLNVLDLGKIPQTTEKSEALNKLILAPSNQPLIIDTYPFTDPRWTKKNLQDGEKNTGSAVYNTNKSLKVFQPRKIISNFTDTYNFTTNRPVTNFSYLNVKNPYTQVTNLVNQQATIASFYIDRTPDEFVPTEGYCSSISPNDLFPNKTTTSILNTPYFINSILNGVANNRKNDQYPFVQSAYLFLNSLPLATLREKYKSLNGSVTEDLDYISSCFKKFGAIHKLPYAWILKLGSNWHRYKKYKENGIDILSSAWKNFDYVSNYSPILSSITQTYSFIYQDIPYKITLQNETDENIKMTVGFYPKLINDFNFFYTGYDLYKDYTDQEIQNSITNLGMKVFNFSESKISALQNLKNLELDTISVLVPKFLTPVDNSCDIKNNTQGLEYYIIPSFGSKINQTKSECVSNPIPITSVNLTSNPNVYNGSVRTLWSAPNYGYFDSDQITYPQFDSYMTKIDATKSSQSALSLLMENEYSKIEEIFSIFEKRILDSFEKEFLNFCKPQTNNQTEVEVAQFLQSTVNINANFRNFQSLFKSLMLVPSQGAKETDNEYFSISIENQFGTFVNGIKAFLEYDVIFKYGNPSNYKRRIWDSYLSYESTPKVTDPIDFGPYIKNTLPTLGGSVTLNQSKINNKKAWVALETEVGFSTISGVSYSSQGSYITNFFIENNINFSAENIVLLAPIIKIWATQKLLDPQLSVSQFRNRLSLFLQDETRFQNYLLDQVLTQVKLKLPDQQQLPERVIKSAIQGEISKVELYEVFKALNDKWISGGDYTSKTLFEDILFLDRASRNIGDKIILDIFDLKNMFKQESLNEAMSVFVFISGILIKNNFTVMNLPSYVNFYNVQNINGTTSSQAEGSLEFANNLWGTFLNVDYRNSSSKMVCFFVGKPSEYLELSQTNFRYRNDGFDMSKLSENPLLENQNNKTDWAVSNRCVGFNVDIGTRNQNIFYSFSIDQQPGKATSESINSLYNLINQASGRNVATQNVGLFNLYKTRSYKCDVVALGNAMIQPTMYFNLRHVPMFYGPYMITDVSHSIQQGQFQTTFSGIRQSKFDLPAIDNFLQTLNQNLLTKLQELLKIERDKTFIRPSTNNQEGAQISQKSDTQVDASNSCVNNINPNYAEYTVTTSNLTTLKPNEFAKLIKEVTKNESDLGLYIFLISYVASYVENGNNDLGQFNGFNNNFGNIFLSYNWSATSEKFTKNYFCLSVKASSAVTRSEPIVSFKDAKTYIEFMSSRLKENVKRINKIGFLPYYVCCWPENKLPESYYSQNYDQFETLRSTFAKAIGLAIQPGVNLLTIEIANKIINESKTKSTTPSPGVTPTPTPIPPLPGFECPPPTIYSFAPLTGNTGTIIQINGNYLENVIGVTINGTMVDMKSVTIFNNNTMRVSVPKIGSGNDIVVGDIKLSSQFGNSISVTSNKFTFNPAMNAASAASPGSFQNDASAAGINQTLNNNPQEISVYPLKTIVNTKNQAGGNEVLTVVVNSEPNVGIWNILPTVEYNYEVKYIETGSNNSIVERNLASGTNKQLNGYVTPNGQQFSITNDDFTKQIFKDIISSEKNRYLKIYTTLQLVVKPQDKIKNPQNVLSQNNFIIVVPPTESSNQIGGGSISLVYESNDVNLPSFFGPKVFNIIKPAGGYLTFQFNGTNCEIIDYRVYKLPELSILNLTVRNNTDTKYTNEINLNSLGLFQLSINYKNTSQPNKVFTANSQTFTL